MSGTENKLEVMPITVITCGHVDNGKSTLTVVTKYLFGDESIIKHGSDDPFAEFVPLEVTIEDLMGKVDKSKEEKARGVTIEVTTVPLAVPMPMPNKANKNLMGLVSLSDCPGHQDYQGNTIAGAKGADGALILVEIKKGVTAETGSHITIAAFSQGAGLHLSKERNRELMKNFKVVVVINKIDLLEQEFSNEAEAQEAIDEHAGLIEMEFLDIADKFGFHEENIRFVRTSALDMLNGMISGGEKQIQRLKDFYTPMREFFHELIEVRAKLNAAGSDSDGTYMYLENVLNIPGVGEICTGKVRGGRIKLHDKLYACGPGIKESEMGPYVVVGIQAFHNDYEEVGENFNVGLKLRGLPTKLLSKGCVLAKKTIMLSRTVEAEAIFSDVKTLRELVQQQGAFKRKIERRLGFEPNGNDGYTSMPLKIVSFTHNGKTEVFDPKKGKNPAIPLGVPVKITGVVLGNPLPLMEGSAMILREANMNVGQLSVTKVMKQLHSSLEAVGAKA